MRKVEPCEILFQPGDTEVPFFVLLSGSMEIVVFAGLAFAGSHAPTTAAAERAPSLASVGAAMVPVLFAYGGWQTANFIAAKVKQPERKAACSHRKTMGARLEALCARSPGA